MDFCTGVKGVKIMYDFISKEILNPETVPERVEELLSLLIGQQVHIKEVLRTMEHGFRTNLRL